MSHSLQLYFQDYKAPAFAISLSLKRPHLEGYFLVIRLGSFRHLGRSVGFDFQFDSVSPGKGFSWLYDFDLFQSLLTCD